MKWRLILSGLVCFSLADAAMANALWLEVDPSSHVPNHDPGLGKYDYVEVDATTFMHYGTDWSTWNRSGIYLYAGGEQAYYAGTWQHDVGANKHLSTGNIAPGWHGAGWKAGSDLDVHLQIDSNGTDPWDTTQFYDDELMLIDVQKQDLYGWLAPTAKCCVLQFKINIGNSSHGDRTLTRLWVKNDGTLTEGAELLNDSVFLYYERGDLPLHFGGNESSVQLWGDYGGNAGDNNEFGHDALSVTITNNQGLNCYLVVTGLENSATAIGKIAQFKLMSDGLSLDDFGSSHQKKLRVDETLNANPLRVGNTLRFAGRDWLIKTGLNGPGDPSRPNWWSPDCVWTDTLGRLHLEIKRITNTVEGITTTNWNCGEVASVDSLGYGEYLWQLNTRYDTYHTNVVGGLFTYAHDENEIDIELTEAFYLKNTGKTNLHYSVQPIPELPFHRHRDKPTVLNRGVETSHRIIWKPNHVQFDSWYGHSTVPPQTNNPDYIFGWTYVSNDIPFDQSDERAIMNLWLYRSRMPTAFQEMIITNFIFTPAGQMRNCAFFEDFEGKPLVGSGAPAGWLKWGGGWTDGGLAVDTSHSRTGAVWISANWNNGDWGYYNTDGGTYNLGDGSAKMSAWMKATNAFTTGQIGFEIEDSDGTRWEMKSANYFQLTTNWAFYEWAVTNYNVVAAGSTPGMNYTSISNFYFRGFPNGQTGENKIWIDDIMGWSLPRMSFQFGPVPLQLQIGSKLYPLNLLTNGDFESAADFDASNPWIKWDENYITAAAAEYGKYGAEMQKGRMYQNVPGVAGTNYTFTIRGRKSGNFSAGDVQLHLRFDADTDDSDYIWSTNMSLAMSTNWQTFSLTATSPVGTAYVRPWIYIWNGTAGACHWDDAVLLLSSSNVLWDYTNTLFQFSDADLTGEDPFRMKFNAYVTTGGLSRGITDYTTQMNARVGRWMPQANVTNYNAAESSSYDDTVKTFASNVWRRDLLRNDPGLETLITNNYFDTTYQYGFNPSTNGYGISEIRAVLYNTLDGTNQPGLDQFFGRIKVVDDDPAPPVVGSNLLRNASFEDVGISDPQEFPALHWEYLVPATNQGGSDYSTRQVWRSREGVASMTLHNFTGSSNQWDGDVWQDVTNRFGPSAWMASAWFFKESLYTGTPFLVMEFRDPAGAKIGGVTNKFELPDNIWTRVGIVGTTPTNTAWVRFVAGASNMRATNNGVLYVDEAFLGRLPLSVKIGDTQYFTNDVTDGALAEVSASSPLRFIFNLYDPISGMSRGTTNPNTQTVVGVDGLFFNNASYYADAESSSDTKIPASTSVWKYAAAINSGTIQKWMEGGVIPVDLVARDADGDRTNDFASISNRLGFVIVDDDAMAPSGHLLYAGTSYSWGDTATNVVTDDDLAQGRMDLAYQWYDSSGIFTTNIDASLSNAYPSAGDMNPNWNLAGPLGQVFGENKLHAGGEMKGGLSQPYVTNVLMNVAGVVPRLIQTGEWFATVSAQDCDNDRGSSLANWLVNGDFEQGRANWIFYAAVGSTNGCLQAAAESGTNGLYSRASGNNYCAQWVGGNIANKVFVFSVRARKQGTVTAGVSLQVDQWTSWGSEFKNIVLPITSSLNSSWQTFTIIFTNGATIASNLFLLKTWGGSGGGDTYFDNAIVSIQGLPGYSYDRAVQTNQSLGPFQVTDEDTDGPVAELIYAGGAFAFGTSITNATDGQLAEGTLDLAYRWLDPSGLLVTNVDGMTNLDVSAGYLSPYWGLSNGLGYTLANREPHKQGELHGANGHLRITNAIENLVFPAAQVQTGLWYLTVGVQDLDSDRTTSIDLLKNSGFELQGSDAIYATNWVENQPDLHGYREYGVFRQWWAKRSGAFGMGFYTNSNTATRNAALFQEVTNRYGAGKLWLGGGWFYRDANYTNGSTDMKIEFYSSSPGGTKLSSSSARPTLPSDAWSYVSVTATAPNSTAWARLVISVTDQRLIDGGLDGSLKLDDVSLSCESDTRSVDCAVQTNQTLEFSVRDDDMDLPIVGKVFTSDRALDVRVNGAPAALENALQTTSATFRVTDGDLNGSSLRLAFSMFD
ncbi:MAG: hypothetical protein V2A34_02990, partial [Lentisphaerota bacterium]